MDMLKLSRDFHNTNFSRNSFVPFNCEDVEHLIEGYDEKDKEDKLSVFNTAFKFYTSVAESPYFDLVEVANSVSPDIAPMYWVRDSFERSFSWISKTPELNMYKVLTNLEGVDSPLWKMYSDFMEAVGTPVNVEDTKIYKAAETLGKIYFCICLNDERISKIKINKGTRKVFLEASEYFSEKFDDPRYVEVFNQKFGKDNPAIKLRKFVTDWSEACRKYDRYGVAEVEQEVRNKTTDSEWFNFLCEIYKFCRSTGVDRSSMFPSKSIGDLLYKGVLMSTLKGWNDGVVFKMITECPEDFLNIDADKTPHDPCLASLTALSKIGVSLTEAAYRH